MDRINAEDTWTIEKELTGLTYVLTDISRNRSGCTTYKYKQKGLDKGMKPYVIRNEERAREIAEIVHGTAVKKVGE